MVRCWLGLLGVLSATACGSPAEPARPTAAVDVAPTPPPVTPPPSAVVASPAPSAPAPAVVAVPSSSEQGRLVIERTLPVGKWPEGVVVVDDVAWVAESGARRIARVPLDGKAPSSHVSVGRLPVQIARASNGKVYTLAHTDKTLWEIDPATSRARVHATVADCPESMALDGSAVWILLWSKCSSAGSSVVRVDLASAKQSMSAATGDDACAIAPVGDRTWVARGNGKLSSVDIATLKDVRNDGATSSPHMSCVAAAGRDAIYASRGSVVSRTDAATGRETHTASLTERVAVIAAEGDLVWVAGVSGTIWGLDPATLRVRKELKTPSVEEPRALARWGERFVVTVHGSGEAGRLVVLAAAPSASSPVASPAGGGSP